MLGDDPRYGNDGIILWHLVCFEIMQCVLLVLRKRNDADSTIGDAINHVHGVWCCDQSHCILSHLNARHTKKKTPNRFRVEEIHDVYVSLIGNGGLVRAIRHMVVGGTKRNLFRIRQNYFNAIDLL